MRTSKPKLRIGQWPSLLLMAAGVLTLAASFAAGLTRHNAPLFIGLALVGAGAFCFLAALRRG